MTETRKQIAQRHPLTRIQRGATTVALLLGIGLTTTTSTVHAAPTSKSTEAPSSQKAEASMVRVDINTADQTTLETLPGIGPSKAQAILKLRKRLGRFKHLRALLRVKGIGRKTLKKLTPHLLPVDAK